MSKTVESRLIGFWKECRKSNLCNCLYKYQAYYSDTYNPRKAVSYASKEYGSLSSNELAHLYGAVTKIVELLSDESLEAKLLVLELDLIDEELQ